MKGQVHHHVPLLADSASTQYPGARKRGLFKCPAKQYEQESRKPVAMTGAVLNLRDTK